MNKGNLLILALIGVLLGIIVMSLIPAPDGPDPVTVAQTPALSSYQATVERYQRGSHVASVLDLLKVNPTDAKRDALVKMAGFKAYDYNE